MQTLTDNLLINSQLFKPIIVTHLRHQPLYRPLFSFDYTLLNINCCILSLIQVRQRPGANLLVTLILISHLVLLPISVP
jgi:hypothetical protein